MLPDFAKLIICLAACLGAGAIGAIFTTPSIRTWYVNLKKPTFTPPNWLFGPAWTVLYILMGVSAFLVWRAGFDTNGVVLALVIFLIQLILNILWSVIFFGYHSPIGGLILIILLWIAILASIIKFWGISEVAGGLLIPYLGWVTFASALNFEVWRLNRGTS